METIQKMQKDETDFSNKKVMPDWPKGRSASNKVYYQVIEYIKQLVRDEKIKFGGKIPSERELMETLGLGRNSVREALRMLEHMGLIESHHGKGNYLVNHMGQSLSSVFSVLLFTKESNYLEVSQLRRAIEVQAFAQAADRIGEEERKAFSDIICCMEQGDYSARVQADHDFHQLLIKCSGNHLLELLMRALSEVCREEILLILEDAVAELLNRWLVLHQTIYQCLMDGDKVRGVDAVLEHYRWIDAELEKRAGEL